MSLARKCDRCKKLFEPKLIRNGHTNGWYKIHVNMGNGSMIIDELYNSDLCPECYEEFRKWMEKIER